MQYMGDPQYDDEMEYYNQCAAYQEGDVNNDPKKFDGYPSCYLHKIIPAGKLTFKSESVRDIIFSH